MIAEKTDLHTITFSIIPFPPFRLDLTVWTLRRRPENTIDRWDGETYRRIMMIDGEPVEVAVTQTLPPESPRLQVTVTSARIDSKARRPVTSILNHTLGLQIDLSKFYQFAFKQKKLGSLAKRFRGMRPPRFPSLFEAIINAIACQQVTLTLGIIMLGRLTKKCGRALIKEGLPAYAFPQPEDLADHDPLELRQLGFSLQKSRAMIGSAEEICRGRFDQASLTDNTNEAAIDRLQELRGIGRWSAEYILLRGLGRLHVFPGDDVGIRKSLAHWLGIEGSLDFDGVRQALNRWKDYGGLIYFHLLLNGLAEKGCLS
jgi:DNA-3-methyladenine glycosylase II